MSETRLLDRLTASDLYAVIGDDVGKPWDIGALAVVDGTTLFESDGRLRIEDIRARLAPRLHLVPRFRQVLFRPSLGLGWPLWVDAQCFDLTHHVRVHPLPPRAGEAELLDACEALRRRPLDPSRPLWELWLLPGLPDRRVGLFVRLHHALADGASGVAAFGALLDVDPNASSALPPPWTPSPLPEARELLEENLERRRRGVRRLLSHVVHPLATLHRSAATLPAWREVFAEERAPRTSLNGPVGAHRRLTLVRTRLDLVKHIAHAHDAKVNDVVLVAVTLGLRDLLASRGETVEDLVLRAMVAVSLHNEQPGQARGNHDGMMTVRLPLAERDPVRLLHLIAEETTERKQKVRPQAASTGIFRFSMTRRAAIWVSDRQRMFNLSTTNVPGPPVPLYLAGAELLEVFPVVPLVGNQTLNVGVLSYAGQLNLTAVADPDACPDIATFANGVQTTLAELSRPILTAASRAPVRAEQKP